MKYIPLNKRTKKAQKEYHAKQRLDWNGINPATRVFPDGKTFDRNRIKAETKLTLKELE